MSPGALGLRGGDVRWGPGGTGVSVVKMPCGFSGPSVPRKVIIYAICHHILYGTRGGERDTHRKGC